MTCKMYSTGCPKCNVLMTKLRDKDIPFDLVTDVQAMLNLGISQVPVLSVDEELLDFGKAVEWVNNYGG